MRPLFLVGGVIKGFGRGSKELGIPTANLPLSALGTVAMAAPSATGTGKTETAPRAASAAAGAASATESSSSSATASAPASASASESASGTATVAAAAATDGGVPAATGIYYGHAQVPGIAARVFPMVMSVGWNPYYKNVEKTVEVHIIHSFDNDFYGEEMRAVALGYIRPERDFAGLDELIAAINADIAEAKVKLAEPENAAFAELPFFTAGAPPPSPPPHSSGDVKDGQ
jgi:riboflavin kinase